MERSEIYNSRWTLLVQDQVRSISATQVYISCRKLTHSLSRSEENMIISIGIEIPFDKIEHSFLMKRFYL